MGEGEGLTQGQAAGVLLAGMAGLTEPQWQFSMRICLPVLLNMAKYLYRSFSAPQPSSLVESKP